MFVLRDSGCCLEPGPGLSRRPVIRIRVQVFRMLVVTTSGELQLPASCRLPATTRPHLTGRPIRRQTCWSTMQQKPFKLQLRDFRGTLYLPIADHGSRVTEQTDSFVLKYIYFFWCLECLKKNQVVGNDAGSWIRWSDGNQSDASPVRQLLSVLSFCLSAGFVTWCSVYFFTSLRNTESLSSLQDFIDSRLKPFKGPNKPIIIWTVGSKDGLI